jgi:tetratricopeptide (TPR) repeat protein
MVFQLNNKKFSRISRNLKPARKAFLTGDTKQAFQLVDNLRHKKAKLLKKSQDVALLRDIHISVGRTHTAQAIIRYACRCFPGDIFVQLSGLILRSQRHNSISLLEQAKALERLCSSSEDFALWNAVNARLSAGLGMMETSAEWLKKAESLLKISYFEAWHHYCLTHLIRRDWVNAVKHAQSLINVDSCLDNRIMLVRALLSKGDLTQAKLHIKSIDAAKGQSYIADSLSIQFYYFIGNFDAAISRLESLRSHWPEIPTSSIDSTMVQLYWLQGDVESAKILAKSTNDTFLDTLNTANSNAKRKLIALPVMMQEPMMCLPTTVAMVASAYETELVARDLFHDMRGNDGTEIWRMQQHMESIGFEVFYIYPNYKLVKACLDRGHPLIGSKVSLFSAHVEVIAGYDEGLDGLFIRDPESLTPYFVDKEYLSTAYKAAGNYLMALAPRRALNWLPNSAINQDATNIIQLKRAIALGALDKAQQCFDAITDNSESSYYRDLYAFGVFLSPLQYIESMKLHASRDELDDILRLNAVLSTQDVTLIQDWVTDYQEKHKTLSKDFNQYLKMLIVRTQRNYAEVLKILDYLIARSPSTDALWSYKAEAELELGEMEAAKKSIQIALDLSPTSYGVKRKIREISPYQESYNDKLSQMKTQLDEYPGIYELEEEVADLLIEGSDGLEYEQSIKACIIKRPLFPWNYNKLANWYLQQDREDLARNILDQGRLLLTDEELPRRHFEVDQSPSREIQQESCSIEGLLRSIEAKSSSKEALKYLRNMINGWFSGHLPSESEQHLLHQLDFRIPKWLLELPLSWWEQAYLIGITYAIKDRNTDRDRKHDTLTKFLPARLPHNTALMLLAINKAVKIYPLSPVACSCLYEWETKQFDGESEWRHDVAFDLAYLRELSGYFNEAQARYADIIKRIPGYYPAYYRVACVYDRKGMKNEAIQQYLSCISIAPNHAGALSSLIDVLTNLNEIPQARDWCEYKVKVNPYSFSCIEQWINPIVA